MVALIYPLCVVIGSKRDFRVLNLASGNWLNINEWENMTIVVKQNYVLIFTFLGLFENQL